MGRFGRPLNREISIRPSLVERYGLGSRIRRSVSADNVMTFPTWHSPNLSNAPTFQYADSDFHRKCGRAKIWRAVEKL